MAAELGVGVWFESLPTPLSTEQKGGSAPPGQIKSVRCMTDFCGAIVQYTLKLAGQNGHSFNSFKS